ncbi:hypothetical protein RND81_09G216300 [Saponaria officinalis]|uniref:Uncharacterized protein n=1 Tax=Saponaria officinalis TaxID=3572 RepID=A0AAW1IQ14_SAPOF
MDDFRLAMDDCGLLDLGYTGDTYKWWNKQSEPNDIYERLDRALVNPEWVDLYPSIMLHHLARESSNHISLKVCRPTGSTRRRKRLFKFEDMWVTSEHCEEIFQEAWMCQGSVDSDNHATTKIRRCANALINWSREEFGDTNRKLSKARKKLAFIDSCRPTEEMVMERRDICLTIDKLVTQEETYWRQRSRIDFLKEGDRNTKCFHLKASGRCMRNKITKLMDSNGEWVSDEKGLENLAHNFFNDLFASSNPNNFEVVLGCVEPLVTEEMNVALQRHFTVEEVKYALDQMHPNKARLTRRDECKLL